MAEPVYTYYFRGADNIRTEAIDVWTNFETIRRFNKVGSWNLEIPVSAYISRYLTETTGIIIQRDGVTVFSGPAGNEYEENSHVIRASGPCDNVLLETPARPTPSLESGPYPDEYDVNTGTASSIMINLVSRNIGPAAPAAWQLANLFIFDPVIGGTVTARARFDPLITLLAELASTPLATGLGFDILQADNFTNQLTFRVFQPQDRHLETIFSQELHTASDYTHLHTNPQANYFIVAGGDEYGANRVLAEGGDVTNIAAVGRRIAAFVDRRGVTDPSELNLELSRLLAGTLSIDQVEIIPTPVPSLVYGTDYELGDYVDAVVKGVHYPRLVREINMKFDLRRGPIITPLIGDPNSTGDLVEAQHLNSVINRVGYLERNWNQPDDGTTNEMLHPFIKWMPGDIKTTTRNAAQLGWLFTDGTDLSRSTYSDLFSAIGTTYGSGSGSTFRVPDTQNRFIIGKGNTHTLGTQGGSATLNIAHDHSGAPHTHVGSHSHGYAAHRHQFGHNHTNPSGLVSTFSAASGGNDVAAKSHGHGNTNGMDTASTTGSGEFTSGGASATTTDSDSNAPGATFTGATSSGGSTALANEPLNIVFNHMIYTGVT